MATQALQRQGSRARKRSAELAAEMLAQARADRERLRVGGAGWADADLEGPLVALARNLRRPNATFELPLEPLAHWERARRRTRKRAAACPTSRWRRRSCGS